MVSQQAIDSLTKNLAKLQDRLANPPEDATAEELAELEQSILDLSANIEKFNAKMGEE